MRPGCSGEYRRHYARYQIRSRYPDAWTRPASTRQTSWDREKFFALDDDRRAVIAEVEELQATRNAESKKIGSLMKEGKKDEAEAAKEAVRQVNEKNRGPEQPPFRA